MTYKKDGVIFSGDLTIGDVVYPINWWNDPAQRTLHGVLFEPDPPPPPPTQAELDALTAQNINSLWQSAHEYEMTYISGVAVGLLTIGAIKQTPKAMAVVAWSQSLWDEYYARKALITSDRMTTMNDFSDIGVPPFTIPELRKELGL